MILLVNVVDLRVKRCETPHEAHVFMLGLDATEWLVVMEGHIAYTVFDLCNGDLGTFEKILEPMVEESK